MKTTQQVFHPTLSDNRRRASTTYRRRRLFNPHRPAPRADYFNPEVEFFVATMRLEKLPRQLDGVKIPRIAWRILQAIVSYSQKDGIVAFATVDAMAARAGCAPNTFRKWVRLLERLGFLVVDRRAGSGEGRLTNLYILQPCVYWNAFDPRVDRKTRATCGNNRGFAGEAKRNNESEVLNTTTVTVQTREDLLKTETCQSGTQSSETKSKAQAKPFRFNNAPEHPEETAIHEQLAIETRPVDPRRRGVNFRNIEAVRWLIALLLAKGVNPALIRPLALIWGAWFVQAPNNLERYASHVAAVISKFPEFWVWWSQLTPEQQQAAIDRLTTNANAIAEAKASAEASAARIREFCARNADALEHRPELAPIAAALREETGAGDVGARLEELEGRMVSALPLSADQAADIAKEFNRQMRPYARHFHPDQVEMHRAHFFERETLKLFNVPRLSLFFMT